MAFCTWIIAIAVFLSVIAAIVFVVLVIGIRKGDRAPLLTLPTYVSNLRTPFKVTSANYRVGADNSMAITITVKNRQSNDRSLTGLIIGQPPNRWKRLRPKWWVGARRIETV
jgi:hypothetical protein